MTSFLLIEYEHNCFKNTGFYEKAGYIFKTQLEINREKY
jgi:hypothetical protein